MKKIQNSILNEIDELKYIFEEEERNSKTTSLIIKNLDKLSSDKKNGLKNSIAF